jgi:ferredoxin
MRVRLEPSGLDFETEAGTTLLKAAEAAGIALPSSCRNGTCRTCICRRLSGETRHTIDWPGLSADEKDEGWILPCVAEALGDLTLDAPQAFSVFEAV